MHLMTWISFNVGVHLCMYSLIRFILYSNSIITAPILPTFSKLLLFDNKKRKSNTKSYMNAFNDLNII